MRNCVFFVLALALAACESQADSDCGGWLTKCGERLATMNDLPPLPCRAHDPETVGESFYIVDQGFCSTCDEFGWLRTEECSLNDCNNYLCPFQIANPTR